MAAESKVKCSAFGRAFAAARGHSIAVHSGGYTKPTIDLGESMSGKCSRAVAAALACVVLSPAVLAECTIDERAKTLDPVEVGFCESDAVFVGKVDARLETIRAFTPEGATSTKHYRIEMSTVGVLDAYKSKPPAKVTMIADLYDKQSGAFSFKNGEEYLVFAKRLPEANEYAGASARCSVQPTLLLADAKKAREQLEQHRKGSKKIDCDNIRPKSAG